MLWEWYFSNRIRVRNSQTTFTFNDRDTAQSTKFGFGEWIAVCNTKVTSRRTSQPHDDTTRWIDRINTIGWSTGDYQQTGRCLIDSNWIKLNICFESSEFI